MFYLMTLVYVALAVFLPLYLKVASFLTASLLLVYARSSKQESLMAERIFIGLSVFALYNVVHMSFKVKESGLDEGLFVSLTAISYVAISVFASFIKNKANLNYYCIGVSLIFIDVCMSLSQKINVTPVALSFICVNGVIFYLSKARIDNLDKESETRYALEDILKTFPEALLKFKNGKLEKLNLSNVVITEDFNNYIVSRVAQKDFSVKTYKGCDKTFEVNIENLSHGSGQLIVLKDISQKISQEMELEGNKTQLLNSSKLAALGEMAGGVAHEINNPLQILSLSTEQMRLFLMADDINKVETELLCDQMESTIERINNIVKGMKIISRDGQNDPYEEIDASEMVHETLKFCKEKFKNNGVKMYVYEEPSSNYKIMGQRVRLSQVFLNLLNNAFDATEEAEQRIIRIGLKTEGDHVLMSFSDNGPGVPETLSQKVFQPFFTTKQIGKGTGLGLSISKEIVEQHKGEFSLDSVERSKFTIKIPSSMEVASA